MKTSQHSNPLAPPLLNLMTNENTHIAHDAHWHMTLHGWRQMRLNPNARVLEIGHGHATHVTPLLEKRRDVHYTGLEMSDLMSEQAQMFNAQMVEHLRAQFWHYDGEVLPSFVQAFDGIFSVNAWHAWSEPRDLLRQLKQQLSPWGKLVLVYAHHDTHWGAHAPEALTQWLSELAFCNIQTQTFDHPNHTGTASVYHTTCATR